MKKIIIKTILSLFICFALVQSAFASGTVVDSGTYVEGNSGLPSCTDARAIKFFLTQTVPASGSNPPYPVDSTQLTFAPLMTEIGPVYWYESSMSYTVDGVSYTKLKNVPPVKINCNGYYVNSMCLNFSPTCTPINGFNGPSYAQCTTANGYKAVGALQTPIDTLDITVTFTAINSATNEQVGTHTLVINDAEIPYQDAPYGAAGLGGTEANMWVDGVEICR
jgi:hypothetical protein